MPFDQHKNLAIAVVAVAPSPPDTGLTLTVAAGHGARYPVAPFDVTIWLATEYPNPANAEVARCTALAGDVLTLVRAQGGTTARLVQPGDLIAESITAQYLQSLEAAIGTTPAPPTLHAPTHAEGGTDPVQLTQSQITGLTTSLTTIEGDITTLEGNVTNLQTIVTSGPVALHAPTHASGGTDPVTVTGLAGYPGGTANFLRADGTFAAPPGGAITAHATTHNTGGSDPLTALSAAILTSGNLPFARVPVSGTSRLLGRGSTGGNGPMQEIALGAGLTMTNTTLSASGGGAPAAHASTHASGGSDPVTVTTLAGYPGGTANFLRADGTFAVPPGGGAGADEVFVGATDPGATYELWYDTAAVSPTTNYALLNAANTFTQSQAITGNLSVSGNVAAAAGIRATGNLTGGTGPGAELLTYLGTAYLNGYDRTAAVYVPVIVAGDRVAFSTGGIERGRMHPSGGFSWGSTTDPGVGNLSVAGDLIVTADKSIRRNTNDGADSGYLSVAGGGGASTDRGSYIGLFGNEHPAGLGNLQLLAGGSPTSQIQFYSGPTALRGVIHASGGFSWGGTHDPAANNFLVSTTGQAAGDNYCLIQPQQTQFGTSTTSPLSIVLFINPNGVVGSIQTSGSATAYATTSDARLKTPLGRHTDTAVLRDTIIHKFVWTADGQPGRGVFAQEAAVVAPFAVSMGTDETDDEGRLTRPWGVDYSKYVPDLITGWQAHEAEMVDLRSEVFALKCRLTPVEAATIGTSTPPPSVYTRSAGRTTGVLRRFATAIRALFPWVPSWI